MSAKVKFYLVIGGLILGSIFFSLKFGYGSAFYAGNRTYVDNSVTVDMEYVEDTSTVDINMDMVNEAIKELEAKGYVRSFIVSYKDKVLVEEYFGNNKRVEANNIHSASKSILSALVGIAVEEGYIKSIDDSIGDYLPEKYFKGKYADRKNITVKNLLQMSAGLEWEENATEFKIQYHSDWVKAILHQDMEAKPGEKFLYSTGVTHVTSALLTNATGMELKEFADKYLFDKMDMTVDYWYQDSQGYYSGGCNFFITPVEMLKFGQMYLNDGMYKGEQIVPKQWVEDSMKPGVEFDEDWDYGYFWWLVDIEGYKSMTAWGFAGQMIHVVPELDLVVVMTTNAFSEFAQEESYISFEIVDNYIVPAIDPTKVSE